MRRRRRTGQPLVVSLFPFLAVLICTLGVLIVLLVLAAKDADVSAQKATSDQLAKRQKELDALKWQYDLRQVQLEGLAQVRPDLLQRLADVRTHRGYLASEIRKLKRRATELAQELLALQQADSEPPPSDASADEQQIEALQSEIAIAQSELAEKKKAARTAGPTRYTIVPHTGSGGTLRRPIYIECRPDTIVLQPFNIRFSASDFPRPVGMGNPLDSALLAIRDYWDEYDVRGTEGSPYPLLIIRPGGSKAYALTRHAMKSWPDEFGYELVESEKQLDFGPVDPRLKRLVEQTILDARTRQQAFIARRQAMGDRLGHGTSEAATRPGLSASSARGGFVATSDWKTDSAELFNRVAQTGGPTSPPGGANQAHAHASPHARNSAHTDLSRAGGQVAGAGHQGPSPNATAAQGMMAANSLANTRGANWALPSVTQGATGYVRPIRIVVGAKTIEIRSALGTEKKIPIGPNMESVVDSLVNEIWKQIESWGMSGSGGYWIPELRTSVLSGGELNFSRIQTLLDSSGILVKEASR